MTEEGTQEIRLPDPALDRLLMRTTTSDCPSIDMRLLDLVETCSGPSAKRQLSNYPGVSTMCAANSHAVDET